MTFQLYLTVDGGGTAWFDDLSLQPLGLVQESVYTPDGRYLKSIKDGAGNIILTYKYTQGELITGNYHSITDALEQEVSYTYDDLSRLTSVTQGTITQSYDYGDKDTLTKITRSDGLEFNLDYDSFGRLYQAKVNNSVLVSHTYDTVGRLERSDFGNNQYQEFFYNSLSRLEELRWDGIPRFAFDYDARGNMVYYKDLVSGDETRVTYDLADRPQVVTQENRRLTFAYDKNNNTTAVNDRLGAETFTTGYAFTPDNLVEGVTTPAGKDVRIFFDSQGRINRYL